MNRVLLPLLVVAAAAVLDGCGEIDSREGKPSGSAMSSSVATAVTKQGDEWPRRAAARPAPGTRIKVVDSEFGPVVADRKGEALYLFEKERGPRAKCYGACASAWPPMLTARKPSAGAGAEASLLGTTERASGKLQVTYAGRPLYYYVGDSPGTILCNDVDEFGGTWLVVGPSGEAAG